MKKWIHSATATSNQQNKNTTNKYVGASYDPTEADLYVVSIWHEVEANGEDTYGPEAAQEIFQTVATSPDAALEQIKRQWTGPIDRIEIIDINPEEGEYDELPFDDVESCDKVTGSSQTNSTVADWYDDISNYPDADPARFALIPEIDWDINPEDVECILYDPIPIDDVASISYVDDATFDDLEASGYAGGYVFTYKNGDKKVFAWNEYPNNLAPLVEVEEYNLRRYR